MLKLLYIQTFELPRHDGADIYDNRRTSARYHSVMRILKPGRRFSFIDKTLPDDFYSETTPNINVSAIVGENGQGKSSLIELMLRVINNMAYALRPAFAMANNSHPRYVRGVYAELAFSIEKRQYVVRVEDTIVYLKESGNAIWRYDYSQRRDKSSGLQFYENNPDEAYENKARKSLAELFYTVVVNYSSYSYNFNDFYPELIDTDELDPDESVDEVSEEDRCWLHGIFHKNDGYQMPIVINPYRSVGAINYNNENKLLQSRIFFLSISPNSPLSVIYKDKKPKSFVFDIVTQYLPTRGGVYTSKRVLNEMSYLLGENPDINTINEIGKRIINVWSRCYGIDLTKCSRCSDADDISRTLNYVVYKTVKIAGTYEKYQKYWRVLSDVRSQLDGNSSLEKYIKKLYNDNTHITQKLIRCIAWLIFAHYSTSMTKQKKVEKGVTDSEIPIGKFSKRITLRLQNVKNYTEDGHGNPLLHRYSDIKPRVWSAEDLLPAPSFRAELRFSVLDNEGEDTGTSVSMSSFSSGEKHIAGSLFTTLYHLNNIFSVWSNTSSKDVKYKYVNIVYDVTVR